jgi:hypothetical protein
MSLDVTSRPGRPGLDELVPSRYALCPSSYGASASGRTRYVAAKPRTAEESISARRIVECVVGHRRSDGVRSSASPERGGRT